MTSARSETVAKLHVATEDYVLATWGNVLILVWRKETTLPGVDAAQRVFDELAAEHPHGVFLMTIVELGASMPPPEGRDALARFLASGAGRMILSAVAHEGTGFRAAAGRSAVTGMAVLGKLPYPHKVFATAAEAGAWFSLNSPAARAWGDRARELIDAVVEVRRRVENGAKAEA